MASARDLVLRFVADTSDLRKSSQSVRKAVQSAAAEAKKAGAGIGGQVAAGTSAAVNKGMSAAWGVAKTAAKVGGAAVATVGTAAVVKGFSRLTAIEDAEAKLRGLGNSAADTKKIMGNAMSAVKGTAFGMDEAATTAATAVAAGVKPGKELEKYLRLTADAAQIAGVDMGEMGSIFNKVTISGRAMTDDIQGIADRGIPIWAKLAEHYKVSGTEMRKMVSDGKVDAKTFQKVMKDTVGGAAKSAGDTTTGAFKNMGAALSRLGASVLNGVFPMFKDAFKGISDAMDSVGPVAEKLGKRIGGAFKGINIGEVISKAMSGVQSALKKVDWGVFINLGKQAAKLLGNIAKTVLPAIGGALKMVVPLLQTMAKVTGTVIKFINDHLGLFTSVAAGIGAIVAALYAYNTVMKVIQIATKAWAAAQAILNAVMSANPIGIIILAVVGLATAFVVAYKKSETFRKIVQAAWDGIKKGAKAFADFFTKTIPAAFQKVVAFIKKHWQKALLVNPLAAAVVLIIKNRDKIVAVFKKLTDWLKTGFATAWAKIKDFFTRPIIAAGTALAKRIAAIRKGFAAVSSWMRTSWRQGWARIKEFFTAPVRAAGTTLAKTIKKIRETFTKIKSWASSTWKQGWAKMRDWITAPIKKGREGGGKALDGLRDRFNKVKTWAGTKFKAGWSKTKDWITSPLGKAKDAIGRMFGRGGSVRAVFSNFTDAVGTIFGRLKKAIGKPLNSVIDFINKGLIRGGINKILNALGVPKKEQIPWISPVSYEAGGPVVGGSPWQRAGRDRYPAYLDRDEHVLTRQEVRKLGGHRRILQWRKAVQQGHAYDYPALAAGGVVRPVPGGFGTFPSYPGHTGVDFPVGTGTPVHAVMAGVIKSVRALTYSYGKHIIQGLPNGMEALYAHLNSFATRAGASVGAGSVIGYTDSTGNSTGPHLHFTLQHPGGNYVDPTGFLNSGKLPGGSTGGGIGGAIVDMLGFLKGLSPVKWLANKASDLRGQITKFLGNNPWARGLARVPGLLISKAKDYMTEKLFGGIGMAEPGGSGVERWRSTIVSALRMNNLPTSSNYVEAWLRQVQSESGGNPKAVQNGYVDVNTISGDLAKGLLQCVTLDTLILTRRGWLRHDQVVVGDETIGYNPKTGRSEWTKITKVVHHETAPVWRIGNKIWHADVTPNHRWWSDTTVYTRPGVNVCPECGWISRGAKHPARGVQVHRNKIHGIQRPDEVKSYRGEFVRTEDLHSNHRIRLAAPATTDGIPGLSLEDAAIIGWLMGDGHVHEATGHRRMAPELGYDGAIYQSKPHMVVKIRALLDSARIEFGESVRYREPSGDPRFGDGERLPQYTFRLPRSYVNELVKMTSFLDDPQGFVLDMSAEQRAMWLDAMIDAEGHRQQPRADHPEWSEYVRIAQADGPVQEAIKLAVYLEGYRPAISRQDPGEGYKPVALVGMAGPHTAPSMFAETRVLEPQPVWCVKTELESWTAGLDGQIFLTGNTISATFNAYKFPGHGDIFNGFDNALAAIGYAKSRYGSKGMLGVIGHGHGYDSGGYLPPGLSLALNKTGRPEPVLTGQQWDALTADPQQHIINITFNAPVDRAGVAREIRNLLRDDDRLRSGVRQPARSRPIRSGDR